MVYIYATIDPWGGETLACWESKDWKNWTYRELNWPTKKACTSSTSKSPIERRCGEDRCRYQGTLGQGSC
jgi:hypothetical protein